MNCYRCTTTSKLCVYPFNNKSCRKCNRHLDVTARSTSPTRGSLNWGQLDHLALLFLAMLVGRTASSSAASVVGSESGGNLVSWWRIRTSRGGDRLASTPARTSTCFINPLTELWRDSCSRTELGHRLATGQCLSTWRRRRHARDDYAEAVQYSLLQVAIGGARVHTDHHHVRIAARGRRILGQNRHYTFTQ